MGYLFCYCIHNIKIWLMRFLPNTNFSKSQKSHKARTLCIWICVLLIFPFSMPNPTTLNFRIRKNFRVVGFDFEILFFFESFSLLHFFHLTNKKSLINFLSSRNKFQKRTSYTFFGTPDVFEVLEYCTLRNLYDKNFHFKNGIFKEDNGYFRILNSCRWRNSSS